MSYHGEFAKVSNDFPDFDDAALSPFGVVFVFWDITGTCKEKDCGLSSVKKDMTDMSKSYAFPPEAPLKYRGRTYSACTTSWGETCFNCATYPKSVGLPIPEDASLILQESLPLCFSRMWFLAFVF